MNLELRPVAINLCYIAGIALGGALAGGAAVGAAAAGATVHRGGVKNREYRTAFGEVYKPWIS